MPLPPSILFEFFPQANFVICKGETSENKKKNVETIRRSYSLFDFLFFSASALEKRHPQ